LPILILNKAVNRVDTLNPKLLTNNYKPPRKP
jgi:hypothetical protein